MVSGRPTNHLLCVRPAGAQRRADHGLLLVTRKQRLQGLLEGVAGTLFVGDLPANVPVPIVGAGLQIEGVMSKRRASKYHPGVRSPDWAKIKRPGWDKGRRWRG